MTTVVTIDTSDWPVKVQRINPETAAPYLGPETVEPHSRANFFLTQQVALAMEELPLPDKILS